MDIRAELESVVEACNKGIQEVIERMEMHNADERKLAEQHKYHFEPYNPWAEPQVHSLVAAKATALAALVALPPEQTGLPT